MLSAAGREKEIMKLRAIGLIALLGAGIVASAAPDAPQFRQLRRIELSSNFDGGVASHGSVASGVASDGTNIYISGWTSGANQTQGVYRITNLLANLANPSVAISGGSFHTQTVARGGSRQTKLEWGNNQLYWGFGMGSDGASAGETGSASGIKSLSSTGAENWYKRPWELLGLSTATGSRRADAFTVDPATGKLVVLNFFNTPFGSAVDANGNFLTNMTVTGAQSSFRDAAALSGGRIITKRATTSAVAGAVGLQTRVFDGTGTLLAPSDVAALPLTSSTNAEEHVEAGEAYNAGWVNSHAYVASSFKNSTPAADGSKISIHGLNPSDFASYLLDGTENGFARFGTVSNGATLQTFLNMQDVTMGGNRYMLVTESFGTRDYLRVYQLVPEPGSALAIGLGAALMLRRRKK